MRDEPMPTLVGYARGARMFWTIVSAVEVAYLVTMVVVVILDKRSPISDARVAARDDLAAVRGPHPLLLHRPASCEAKTHAAQSLGRRSARAARRRKSIATRRTSKRRAGSRDARCAMSGSLMSTAKHIEVLGGGKTRRRHRGGHRQGEDPHPRPLLHLRSRRDRHAHPRRARRACEGGRESRS